MILLKYIISKQLVCVVLIVIIKVIYNNEQHFITPFIFNIKNIFIYFAV